MHYNISHITYIVWSIHFLVNVIVKLVASSYPHCTQQVIYKKNYKFWKTAFNLIMFSALLSHLTEYIAAYISFVHVVLVLLAVIIHQVYQRMKCRNEVPCAQVFKWSSVSRREYQDIDDGLMSNR